jgi:hypothetical protein
MLAINDLASARAAADDLSEIARRLEAPLLYAESAHVTGVVLLPEGEPRACGAQKLDWLPGL